MTIENAKKVYGIPGWSDGFFDINPQGNVVVQQATQSVELRKLAQAAVAKGLTLPLLLRFPHILHQRVQNLCHAFDDALQAEGIDNTAYTAIYPIKVNQQHTVVEHIAGATHNRVGFEAGSKPELIAVLAQALRLQAATEQHQVIVCNGYKDREYIRLALLGQKMGVRVYIVIEQLHEVADIVAEAQQLQMQPLLGLRVRLASIASGKWQNTGGEKAKFGLRAAEVLSLLEQLQTHHLLQTLQLLHFHMGSQISRLNDVQCGMQEAAHYYAELKKLGANITVLDMGGGLPVDYTSANNTSEFSMAYSIQDYALCIVQTLKQVCQQHQLVFPQLFSESGRALTAHHAVLISNIVDIERLSAAINRAQSENIINPFADIQQQIENISETDQAEKYLQYIDNIYNDWQQKFSAGVIGLMARAQVESLYYGICDRLEAHLNTINPQAELLIHLDEKLADKIFCNISIFQSLPDAWGLNQIFPVLPLQGLDKPLNRRAVIHDLTCDSDGQLKAYAEQGQITQTLAFPEAQANELIGFFMVGAYQEILGDMHNLFGDTNTVNVIFDQAGQSFFEDEEFGDTIDELLRYVHYVPEDILQQFTECIEKQSFSASNKHEYLQFLTQVLKAYSYLLD